MLFVILLALAMLATLGVLAAGIFTMARGSQDPMLSNKLMQWRVTLQAVAIALFALAMLASGRF